MVELLLVDTMREAHLYRAIVMQSLEDLYDEEEKGRAKRWFEADRQPKPETGVTFLQACSFGDLDPKKFRYIANLITDGKLSKKEFSKIIA